MDLNSCPPPTRTEIEQDISREESLTNDNVFGGFTVKRLVSIARWLLARWRETNENLTRMQTAESANLIASREARDKNAALLKHATVLSFGSHRTVRELGGEIWRVYDGSSTLVATGTIEECRAELKRRGVECP